MAGARGIPLGGPILLGRPSRSFTFAGVRFGLKLGF